MKAKQQTINVLPEQTALLYKQAPIAFVATVIAACASLYMLSSEVEGEVLFLWFASVILINIYLLVLLVLYSRASNESKKRKVWLTLYNTEVVPHGLAWGFVVPLFMLSNNPVHHLFAFYMFTGMAVGAIACTGSVLRTYVYYMAPLFTVACIWMLSQQDSTYYMMAILTVVFCAASYTLALNHYSSITKELRLGHENKELVSNLVNAKERAETASDAKSQFLAHMSHEIRTPLNSVIGFSNLLNKTSLSGTQKDYLSTISSSARNLLAVINDVLDISSIESGVVSYRKYVFNLRECVENPYSILSAAAYEKQLEYVLLIDDDVPDYVEGCPDRLKQILMNLLGNAVKFTSSGGVKIQVSKDLQQDGHLNLCFSVSDTGIGIETGDFKKLFTPFSQLEKFETRHFEGTGLGLAITKRLLEGMGGVINVESSRGVGTTFRFILPFNRVDDFHNDESRYGFLGQPVFLYDGNPESLSMIRDHLTAFGMDIKVLSSLRKVIECDGFSVIGLSNDERNRLISNDFAFSKSNDNSIVVLLNNQDDDVCESLRRIGATLCLPKSSARQVFYRELHSLLTENVLPMALPASQNIQRFTGKNVLVVDDDPMSRKLVNHYLNDKGANVNEAPNGKDALEIILKDEVDVVFLDIQMPGMSGFEVAKKIRDIEMEKDYRRVPIIAMTAHVLPEENIRYETYGIDDFVLKPVSEKEFVSVLGKWL